MVYKLLSKASGLLESLTVLFFKAAQLSLFKNEMSIFYEHFTLISLLCSDTIHINTAY